MNHSHQGLSQDLQRQVSTLVAILGSIAFNALTNFFPPNGLNVGQLSNTVFSPVLIIPANYAFAIWGLVFTGLIAFGIYQLQTSQRQNPRLRQSGYLLVFASMAQCAWIYLFLTRHFSLSVIAMLGTLGSLVGMYMRLGIAEERVSRQERWFIQIPVSIYLGWISVATVLNMAIALYILNWDAWNIAPEIWTIVMMAVSASIAALITYFRHDIVFTLVIVWALLAIAIRHVDMPLIAITGVVISIGLILITIFFQTRLTEATKRV